MPGRTGSRPDPMAVTSPPDNVDAPLASSDEPPKPGEFKIKERRSWRTWQLLVAILVATILGMWINGDTGGGAPSTKRESTLPPQSAGSTGAAAGGSTATTTTAAGGSSATTTTVAGGSTTTSTAPSTSSAAAAGPARVLLTSPQLQGNWTSPPFTTTAAGWNIGWAFRCAPAPAAGSSFQVFVTPSGSPPSGAAAISETGPSGQSVTALSTLGAQTLVVQAPGSCTWVVKVTGS